MKKNATPLRLQLGSGGNQVPGWINLEQAQLDIRNVLPFPDESVRALFLEHVIEHVTPREAYRFFQEAMRVLEPQGILRLAFPCVVKLQASCTAAYRETFRKNGWGDGTRESCMEACLFEFGHQGAWSRDSLSSVLNGVGFATVTTPVGESLWPDMRNLERHGFVMGEQINNVDTVVIDAVKGGPPDLEGPITPPFSILNRIFGQVAVVSYPEKRVTEGFTKFLHSLGVAHQVFEHNTRAGAHADALGSLKEEEADAVLVLEGGVFQPGFASILRSAIMCLPETWDCLHLSSSCETGEKLASHLRQAFPGSSDWAAYAVHAGFVHDLKRSWNETNRGGFPRLNPSIRSFAVSPPIFQP